MLHHNDHMHLIIDYIYDLINLLAPTVPRDTLKITRSYPPVIWEIVVLTVLFNTVSWIVPTEARVKEPVMTEGQEDLNLHGEVIHYS